ncbi:NAD(P)-binding protein [Chaetomidium leptoderma]|uniref:NAD(P)-binding protein n=1 Tax=Chaetomidium leptoderma TaxID=669021 RepID=A0AAN6VI09_9PEZI|nr:NAD(P)-binding protein [Chaetomidium leptoderma]
MPKFVLTGAGGGIGGVAADYALEIAQPGQKLLFTTSNLGKLPAGRADGWKAKGAEVAEANYDDVESLKKVFEGAEVVAFISTWALGERPRQAANVLAAAKATGVKRVCYTSFIGAGLGNDSAEARQRDVKTIPFLPQDHVQTERLIRGSGLQWNIQRDYLYQDNAAAFFSQSWKFCGDRWLNNSGGRRGAYVAREDCGRVFGALLMGKAEPDTCHTLTGPEAVTDREIFDYINSVSGYKAEFVDMTDDALAAWWRERGLPDNAINGDFSQLPMKLCIPDLLCCGEMVAQGHMAEVTDAVEKLTGRKALGFKENYKKYEQLFPRND